ncbi:hypothetical protein ABZV31_32275 [Streptomyces sp. NPDC005202]|uniref:hypothetical protein n=1 Tax=Streptomyces sp. NPDC005202 TaxID=3157021 RepID=UPI0033A13D69
MFRLGELPLAGAGDEDDPALLINADAIQLFAERAAARAPGFALNRANARTVAEICRRLDGLPLAVELAARRGGTLSLTDILTGLDDQLSLLADGSRTGPGRHRELSAAIDWSHRLLDPMEQAVFRRLHALYPWRGWPSWRPNGGTCHVRCVCTRPLPGHAVGWTPSQRPRGGSGWSRRRNV